MKRARPASRRPRGFTLVELMVGVVLGMFAVLVIMQLLLTSTSLQRLTSTSGNAQISAATGIHVLTRELAEAGLGISAYTVLGCSLGYTASADGAAVTLPALAPVTINPASSIIPAGDANTDTLLVLSGNLAGPSEGDATTALTSSTSYTVKTPTSFKLQDAVIAAPTTRDSSSACALRLARVTAISGFVLSVTQGTANLPIGSAVYSLGNAPAVRAYAVRNGNLTVCDYMAYNCGSSTYTAGGVNDDVWVPVAGNVVSLRAQYGRDTTATPMDGVVDQYDQITPASAADSSGLPAYCSWMRVVGLRLALVTRSQQYDKARPTTSAPLWAGSAANMAKSATQPTLNPTAQPINLSGNSEWQFYRYKTVESAIALRNTIWNGNQATYQSGTVGC